MVICQSWLPCERPAASLICALGQMLRGFEARRDEIVFLKAIAGIQIYSTFIHLVCEFMMKQIKQVLLASIALTVPV